MIAYASLTTNLRNLAALRSAGWGLMISAAKIREPKGFRYCIDNGAWTAYQAGTPFDEAAFMRCYERLGVGADFVVLPDIVAGGEASLAYSFRWFSLPRACPFLLAVQDGMKPHLVAPLVGPKLGIFVGGTTDWKLQTMPQWGWLARERGAYMHVGRVNSMRRIHLCEAAGADSFDGSSASRYAVNVRGLEAARQQRDLFR